MNTSFDLEARRKRIIKIAQIVALIIGGFLFAPFAVATITGLVSIIVVSTIGLLTVNVGIPWFAVTLANWRLKALKSAAAANPIETLENQYGERQVALEDIRVNIKKSYSVLETLHSQIVEHNKTFPNSPSQFLDKYQKLSALVKMRGEKYKTAKFNLEKFSELIDEKRSDWNIAKTMAEASKLADVGEDFQSKLLKDTALNTVQDGLNMAFSELEVSLLDEQHDVEKQASKTTVDVAPLEKKQTAQISDKTSLDLGFDSSILDAEFVPVPVKSKSKTNRN